MLSPAPKKFVVKRLVEEAVPVKKDPVVVPLPFTKTLPATDRRSFGVDEPMPTLPFASIVRADIVEVAKVEAEPVATYRIPPAFLKVQ